MLLAAVYIRARGGDRFLAAGEMLLLAPDSVATAATGTGFRFERLRMLCHRAPTLVLARRQTEAGGFEPPRVGASFSCVEAATLDTTAARAIVGILAGPAAPQLTRLR